MGDHAAKAATAAQPTACAVAIAASPSAVTVAIDSFAFDPPTVTVPAGATVTWVNHDDIPHLVAADDRSFKSPPMDTDDRYAMTFAKPGTYAYFCTLHPHMTGTVVVTAP